MEQINVSLTRSMTEKVDKANEFTVQLDLNANFTGLSKRAQQEIRQQIYTLLRDEIDAVTSEIRSDFAEANPGMEITVDRY